MANISAEFAYFTGPLTEDDDAFDAGFRHSDSGHLFYDRPVRSNDAPRLGSWAMPTIVYLSCAGTNPFGT